MQVSSQGRLGAEIFPKLLEYVGKHKLAQNGEMFLLKEG